MWNLILCIFGIPYWIFRWCKETGEAAGYEEAKRIRNKKFEEGLNDWLERVTNPELEAEIEKKMSNEETAKEYLEELKEAAKELDILDVRFFHSYWETYPNYYCKHYVNAVRVVLANRGSLRFDDARYGFWCDIPPKLRDPRDLTGSVDKRIQFMEWIDKKLKEHGVMDEMCMDASGKLYHLDDRTKRFMGNYIYRPASRDEKVYYFQDTIENRR